MDLTSYLLGKKAGGGGSQPTGTISITENGDYNVSSYATASVNVSGGNEPLLVKDIEDGSDLSNYTFFIDTSDTTAEDITTEYSETMELCSFGYETEDEAHVYQITLIDGASLGDLIEETGGGVYYPNGASFTINDEHIYIINMKTDAADETEQYQFIILSDLTEDEYYADVEIPSTYVGFGLPTDQFTEAVWNCLKVVKLSETPWEVLSGTPGGGIQPSGQLQPLTISFYNYAGSEIDLSLLDTSRMTTMEYMFRDCSNLTSLDLRGLNTENVTTMANLFLGCTSLATVRLDNLDTSNVTSVAYMFKNCSSLTSLDLSNFNTDASTLFNSMFYGCSNLTSVNLEGVSGYNSTTFDSMFYNCSNLTSLDLSELDNTNQDVNPGTDSMFYGCKSLKHLDMRKFDFTKLTYLNNMFGNPGTFYVITRVPNNCLIIVADDTQKQWFSTNFSRFTNVQTVAEYEAL